MFVYSETGSTFFIIKHTITAVVFRYTGTTRPAESSYQ